MKRQRNDELRRRPSDCPDCIKIAAANQDLEDKLREKKEALKNLVEADLTKASVVRQLAADLNKTKTENKFKDSQISELTQRLSSMGLEVRL